MEPGDGTDMTEAREHEKSLSHSATGGGANIEKGAAGSSNYVSEPQNGPAGGSGASDSKDTGQTE